MVTTEKDRQYVSPAIEMIEAENESLLCQSMTINSLDEENIEDLF